MMLSDLGAEVIKVEDPASGGDVGRYVPPFQEGEDAIFFETFNRNKKSLSLDLRHEKATAVLHDLVRVSDAMYSNLRGDQPRKLGITYETLKDVNPRIVCCSLSGFGMTGPRAAEGGYDYMMQGLAGWQSLTGDPEGHLSRIRTRQEANDMLKASCDWLRENTGQERFSLFGQIVHITAIDGQLSKGEQKFLEELAGLLAVRSRTLDVITLGALGMGVLLAALVVPPPA